MIYLLTISVLLNIIIISYFLSTRNERKAFDKNYAQVVGWYMELSKKYFSNLDQLFELKEWRDAINKERL